MNQAVAFNVARWRKAAGLTQQQLGERIGWSADAVSEAERSFAGSRTRQFDADLLAGIAIALGVPVAALLLPPPGCTFRIPGGYLDGGALLRLAIPDNDSDAGVMGEYRDAWNFTGMALLGDDPEAMQLMARWIGDTAGRRAELAAYLRDEREELLKAAEKAAARLDGIARQIEQGEAR